MKKSIAYMIALLIVLFLSSCSKTEIENDKPNKPGQLLLYAVATKEPSFKSDGLT